MLTVFKTIFALLASATILIYSGHATAENQADIYTFNVPAQSLESALLAYSDQSGVQLVMQTENVKNIQSRGVTGKLNRKEAIEELLINTELEYDFTSDNTIIIRKKGTSSDENKQSSYTGYYTDRIILAQNESSSRTDTGAGRASRNSGVETTAANTQRSQGFALEEIIVTARKQEESLQDTPISVSAITGNSLNERDITQISGVADIAPNVNFSFAGTSSGSGSAAVVYIRGVGQNDFTPVTDPGVGIYVDGIYLGRTVGSVLDTLDLERIEVLRGPQGTVFGRNTIGGAISLTTRDPGDSFAGKARFTAGEDDRYEFSGSVDVPLSEDLRATFSGLYKTRDGYVIRADGTDLGDDNVLGGRAKFVWDATDNLQFKLSLDGVREREESAAEAQIDVIETALFQFFFNSNLFGNGSTDPACAAGGGSLNNPNCSNDQFNSAPFRSFETGPSRNNINNYGAAFTAEWDLGSFKIKSVTAYRDLDAEFARASDGTPFPIFSTDTEYKQDQFSQEIQLTGSFYDDRVNWVGGFFYFGENGEAFDVVVGPPPNFPRLIGGVTDNDSYAVFGEAVIDVTDRLRVLGGLRYTDETKRYDATAVTIAPSVAAGFNFLTGAADGETEISFSEVTWRTSVMFDLTDSSTTYFTASRGFKSGGFDQRLTQPATSLPTYSPEFVNLFEIGIKNEFDALNLRLNAAAFFSDYSDVQVSANPPGQINTVTANAADGEIKGMEVEFAWIPVRELFIEGAVGYQDAEYTDINPASNVEVSLTDDFIRTPEFSWSLGASYRVDLGDMGSLTPRLDWNYKSGIEFEPVNSAAPGNIVSEPGYHAVNISAAYRDSSEKWLLKFGVNNVTDEEYLVAGDSNGTIGYALGIFARPRNWYLTLERAFD